MKIRLMGTAEENKLFIEALENAPEIVLNEISKSYPNRGFSNFKRVYIDLQIKIATAQGLLSIPSIFKDMK